MNKEGSGIIMAQKDLSSKLLESEPDVFADIFNALLFTSEETKIVNPENNLRDESTEGFYRGNSGELRAVFQDIAKGYRNGDLESYLACFNIENEAVVKRTVPLKCLGYKYTTLKKQQDLYENKRRALLDLKQKAKDSNELEKCKLFEEEISKLGAFHTIPFISIVLNFDDKRWNEPTNLADLNFDSIYSQFDQPFYIRVFDVKFFTAEERAKFVSDFRIFLEMFCTNTLPKELEDVSLKHPTELVDMVIAFTNNDKLKGIRNKVAVDELEGKMTNMGDIFDNVAAKEAVDSARFYYKKGISQDVVIEGISERLGITLDEAKDIFEKEVLMLETV